MLTAGALFCSDFDDLADPWVGWDRDIPFSRYEVDPNEKKSAPNAARLFIQGPVGSSPDLSIKHELQPKTRFVISAALRLSSGAKPATDAVLLKLQFQKGQLFLRSGGRVVETIPDGTLGSRFVQRLADTNVPLDEWLDVRLEVNLPTGAFSLTVNGSKREAVMETKRPNAEAVLLIAGPMDPKRDDAPDLTVLLDDVFVSAP